MALNVFEKSQVWSTQVEGGTAHCPAEEGAQMTFTKLDFDKERLELG